MKKIFLSLIMSVLFLIGGLSMISMAPPADKFPCKDECSVLVEFGFFPTNGACQSACHVCTNKGENAAQTAVCICKIAEAAGIPGVPDKQCVSTIKTH
jgi:hypothetical protein